MRTFRLIGNATRFALDHCYLSAGCIPAVVGRTLDGKRMTVAREADIIWLDDFRYQPIRVPDALGRYAVHDGENEDICHRAPTAQEAQTVALLLNIKDKLLEQPGGKS